MQHIKYLRFALIACLWLSIVGCATTGTTEQTMAQKDPYENFNRKMFDVNKRLDQYILRPAATGYVKVVPGPVRNSVGNFFSYVGDVNVLGNQLLQARFRDAGRTTGRLLMNTTFGVFGLFDAATVAGIEKSSGDFGQTLHTWGVTRSRYLVLPFFGPTTMRDGAGSFVDFMVSPWMFAEDGYRITALAVETVHIRSMYLGQEDILEFAFDEYTFVRDAYLQNREAVLSGEDVTLWDDDEWDEGYEWDEYY